MNRRIEGLSILITNDDGIESDGIIRLADTTREFGDVVVVAQIGRASCRERVLGCV